MSHEKKDTPKKGIKSTSPEGRIHRAEEDVRYYNRLVETDTPEEVKEGMRILEKQRALDLTSIKDTCKFELQRFINMRGTIDKETGKIHLPLMTVSEQNTAPTIKKIKEANNLITSLEAANSWEEINNTFEGISTSNLGDDLDAVIGKCIGLCRLASSELNKRSMDLGTPALFSAPNSSS
jgi:hypothetical protein